MFWSISLSILDRFAWNLHKLGMIRTRGNNSIFWLKLHVLVNISVNSQWNHHKPSHEPPQLMILIITNHHKPWHKAPWTMTETSTKHDMDRYKSPQTMTWTIMMTQKELCIKPYGFLVDIFYTKSTLGLILWESIWGPGPLDFFSFKAQTPTLPCPQGNFRWPKFGPPPHSNHTSIHNHLPNFKYRVTQCW